MSAVCSHYLNLLFLIGGLLIILCVDSSHQRKLDSETRTRAEEFICSPVANSEKPQYMIGYGSLLLEASKNRTYRNAGENIPVTVKNFSRRWNAQSVSIGVGPTYLGVDKIHGSSFNGIVFQIHSENISSVLKDFDNREETYCRDRVELEELDFNAWNSSNSVTDELKEAEFWIYVNKPEYTDKPSKDYPIVQSYVDIFISGCLEVEQKHGLQNYASQCISTTQGWSFNWVNDRIYPRRPYIYVKNARAIDRLLAAGVPKQFGRIQIE